MNKLKTGKGALKDYHRCLADECDDYAQEPEYYDPISQFASESQVQAAFSNRSKTGKARANVASLWPKFKPDFNFVAASGGVFERRFGVRLAIYLKLSDIARVQRTCRYLYKMFTKFSIWKEYINKNYGDIFWSDEMLSSVNIMQFTKYLKCAITSRGVYRTHEQRKNTDGIVFDTLVIEKDMRKEDRYLVRNIVDFVTVKSQKTTDTITKTSLTGTLTEDVKISWMKEQNQVCVWVAGYQIQINDKDALARDGLNTFACNLFNKKYEEKIHNVYFLNDRYFVVEIEEKSEHGCEATTKGFEVYLIEPEPDWFEKKHLSLCKQVLKETFVDSTGNIKVKNLGGFLVFVAESKNSGVYVKVFDEEGQCLSKSENLPGLEGGLSEVIQLKSVTGNSFILYLLDNKSEVYLLNFSLELGVTIQKVNPKQTSNEEEKKEEAHAENPRFLDSIKNYQHGVYQRIDKEYQSKAFEYLMVYKGKKFYLMNLKNKELVYCKLLGYDSSSKLFNWTIFGEHLYLLIDTTIQVYQLDFNFCSATLIKKEKIDITLRGSSARWILVNPCLTLIVSASSFDESFMSSLQIIIGSTQELFIKRRSWYDNWHLDQSRLDNMVGRVEKWQDISSLGKETVECRFEDGRLLVKTNVRNYFRDFNVCEKRVEKKLSEWKDPAVYDLSEPEEIVDSNEPATSEDMQKNSVKKSFVTNLEIKKNNNQGKMKKNGYQNWKNTDKKADTEGRIERKENKKKVDKYYNNVW